MCIFLIAFCVHKYLMRRREGKGRGRERRDTQCIAVEPSFFEKCFDAAAVAVAEKAIITIVFNGGYLFISHTHTV